MKNKITRIFLAVFLMLTMIPFMESSAQAKEYEEIITTIDDADVGSELNQFEFKGIWIPETGVGLDYNGTEHWSNKNRWKDNLPSFKIKFKGNKIELFGKKDKDLCIYKVVLDGDIANATTIDPYNLVAQSKERLYEKSGLSEGEHTIEVFATNDINAMASTSAILGMQIDYAKTYALEEIDADKDIKTIINDADNGEGLFKYNFSKGWSVSSGYPDAFYKGDEHWVNVTTGSVPYVNITFYGSTIELFGVKEASGAYYDISIDGGATQKVSSYSAKRLTKQSLIKISGLEEKEHTLKLTVLNEGENKATTKYSGEMDYAEVTHKAIPATGIAFKEESVTLEAGLDKQVSAVAIPEYASSASIVYEIENPEIASISETGVVKALKEGNTNIVAKLKNNPLITTTIPLIVLKKGAVLGAYVGSINTLDTQKDYKKVFEGNGNSFYDVAWKNDVINSKIVTFTRGEKVLNAEVSASDFVSGNNIIGTEQVEIKWLKDVKANIGRGNASAPVELFPDVIYKGGKVNIEPSSVQSAWINITIPKDTKAGIYKGTLKVNAEGLETPYEFDYSFEVLDLVQPEPENMDTQVQIWQHPFAVASYYGISEDKYFEEEHLNYMRESMKEYKSLGGKDVVANIVEEAWNHQSYTSDPTMVKWTKKKDGTFTFDYELFDKWINFNIETGVLDPAKGIGQIKCYSIVPWANQITYYDETTNKTVKIKPSIGSDVWKEAWTSILVDFMKHVEEKGWFDITYIAMDERGMDDLKKAVDLIETVKNDDGKHFKISSAMNYQSGNDYSFLDRIDDISIGLSHINHDADDMEKMSAHRKELGLITTVYTCTGDYPSNYTISDPVDNAWVMWYSLSQNTDGFMRWAWDNWVSNPLDNVNYKYWEPGDGWFIYPVEKGVKSDTYYYKTPRYELLKQGVRDINKAKYLMQNSKQLKPEIEAMVASMQRPEQGGNGYGSAVAKSEADRLLTQSEVARMRKGIADFSRQYIESKKVLVDKIEVNNQEVSLMVGDTEKIQAKIYPENATDKKITYTSSDESVVAIVNNELVAKKVGKATITLTTSNPNVTAKIEVIVKAVPEVIDPGEPVEPSDPSKPIKPIEPVEPSEPNKPVVPDQPSNVTKPMIPNNQIVEAVVTSIIKKDGRTLNTLQETKKNTVDNKSVAKEDTKKTVIKEDDTPLAKRESKNSTMPYAVGGIVIVLGGLLLAFVKLGGKKDNL